ncbi:MAG: class I SAM-dependent methyltransferase [Deltaproteobacteria bacterium]|nr:class I SAM-dependent methyltransferase [Deltaproteobacteria bacterium]
MNSSQVIRSYINTFTSLEGKTVLDAPCGRGATSALVRKKGAKVLSFDLFPEFFNVDGQKSNFADLSESLPLPDESVDIIICQEGIEHLPNQLFAIQQFYRVLKKGGELLIITPNISNFAGRLAQFIFESQLIRCSPESYNETIWTINGSNTNNISRDRYYYGHIFLIGMQKLRTLLQLSGFTKIKSMKTGISSTSLFLSLTLYPVIFLMSCNIFIRDYIKYKNNKSLLREKFYQFYENIAARTLLNRKLFLISKKM